MNWRFWRWRSRAAREDDELMNRLKWEVAMARAGWLCWLSYPPRLWLPNIEMVEVKRREWPTIAIWSLDNIAPETNLAGLWWRPTSIANDPGGIVELVKTPWGYVLPNASEAATPAYAPPPEAGSP